MNPTLVYLNGNFVPETEACVSVFDRGFLYGDGVFETMRSYDGRIFRLWQHIRRLLESADLIGLRLSHRPEQLAEICVRLMKRNDTQDCILRLSVTRGKSTGGVGIAHVAEPTIVAFLRSPRSLPADAYSNGVSAKIVSIRRTASSSLSARMKSMNFLNNILAKAEAESGGADEAIILNQTGYVAEASTANIFFVRDNCLVTPSLKCDILAGITRSAVLELAPALGIQCEERGITPSEIVEFSECFLSSSGVELLPIRKIDGSVVGAGKPGPVYARLHEAYRDLVRKG
ncbi:branched-chain-amino-acid transaminase [Candidatus Poribacteria bacterium]|nr:branched-chain-amino-acid transaminase [Candidatus Poribacteria bacterium]